MFLNKWTAQLSFPGEITEESFDSEEELLGFVQRMESEWRGDVRPSVNVIDPAGNEKSLTAVGAD
jgi:hypothetical protein